ncbi:hypothetical protein EG329_007972 [Mollisiaceae sp. DMI_Dod_QoI]|nr:hypothetical protein EG329_007972 [Helotiales sp. DMI_Dod_QoI]
MEPDKAEVMATPIEVPATTLPAYQTNSYLWALRFIQIVFALVIVGIAGSNMSDWHSMGCSSPSGLSFNFAIGLLSLFLIIYFILSSGPYFKLSWYSFYAVLGLELLFIIFWIVAAALAGYSCDSLCKACSVPGAEVDNHHGFYVWVNDFVCYCYFQDDSFPDSFTVKRDSPAMIFRRGKPVSGGHTGSSTSNQVGRTLEKGISKATKQGLDAAMILLLITSLITVLSLRYSSERRRNMDAEAEQVDQHVDNTIKMEGVGPSAE